MGTIIGRFGFQAAVEKTANHPAYAERDLSVGYVILEGFEPSVNEDGTISLRERGLVLDDKRPEGVAWREAILSLKDKKELLAKAERFVAFNGRSRYDIPSIKKSISMIEGLVAEAEADMAVTPAQVEFSLENQVVQTTYRGKPSEWKGVAMRITLNPVVTGYKDNGSKLVAYLLGDDEFVDPEESDPLWKKPWHGVIVAVTTEERPLVVNTVNAKVVETSAKPETSEEEAYPGEKLMNALAPVAEGANQYPGERL